MQNKLIAMLSDLDMKYRSEIKLIAERRNHEMKLRRLKANMCVGCVTIPHHSDLGEALLVNIKKSYNEVVDVLEQSYDIPRNDIKKIAIDHHYDLVSTAFTTGIIAA